MTENEFLEKMSEVWAEYQKLQAKAQAISQQLTELQQAGMTNATIHTRSDNGAMELLHPTGSTYEQQTGRRREYVGKKPEAQQEAQARVRRFTEFQELRSKASLINDKIRWIEYRVEYLRLGALGGQAKLFSEVGTSTSSAERKIVPTDWRWLTPQYVINYFKASPILAEIAGDVEAVLGKLGWADRDQRAA